MAALVAQAYLTGKAKKAAKRRLSSDSRRLSGFGGESDEESGGGDGRTETVEETEDDEQKDPNPNSGGSFLVPPIEESARSAGERLKSAPVEGLFVLRSGLGLVVGLVSYISTFTAIVLLIFIVHQLFIWVDKDPEGAFDQAAVLLEIAETIWDAYAILSNAVIDISNAALIPTWNAYTFYVVEPIVILVLEVFSLLFLGQDYNGVVDEGGFPYAGLDCTSTDMAAAWCGRYNFYENKLRAQHENTYINNSLVIGTATARRLSELAGDTDTFVTPAFELDNVTDALDELTTLSITLAAPLADIGTSVLDEVFAKSARIIFDLVFFLLRNIFEVLRWLVKSGLLTVLVTIGIDFFVSCTMAVEQYPSEAQPLG